MPTLKTDNPEFWEEQGHTLKVLAVAIVGRIGEEVPVPMVFFRAERSWSREERLLLGLSKRAGSRSYEAEGAFVVDMREWPWRARWALKWSYAGQRFMTLLDLFFPYHLPFFYALEDAGTFAIIPAEPGTPLYEDLSALPPPATAEAQAALSRQVAAGVAPLMVVDSLASLPPLCGIGMGEVDSSIVGTIKEVLWTDHKRSFIKETAKAQHDRKGRRATVAQVFGVGRYREEDGE